MSRPAPEPLPTRRADLLAALRQDKTWDLAVVGGGATGLGVLGLITSVMFMRSRSSQREFYDRHSNRRRY